MNGLLVAAWSPRVLSLLRIVVGLLFLEHGLQKLAGFPPVADPGHVVPLNSMAGYAGFFELGCGLLVAIGLFTRPAAFLASGVMAVAYWTVHARMNFFPVNNMGDAAILYCFAFLYLAAAGPGPWSLDALRGRRRAPQA